MWKWSVDELTLSLWLCVGDLGKTGDLPFWSFWWCACWLWFVEDELDFSFLIRLLSNLQCACNVLSNDLRAKTRELLSPAGVFQGWTRSFPPCTPGAHVKWSLGPGGGMAAIALTKLTSSSSNVSSSSEPWSANTAPCPKSDRSSMIADPESSPYFSRSWWLRWLTLSNSASCSPWRVVEINWLKDASSLPASPDYNPMTQTCINKKLYSPFSWLKEVCNPFVSLLLIRYSFKI